MDVGRGGVRGGVILYPVVSIRHAEQCRRIYIYIYIYAIHLTGEHPLWQVGPAKDQNLISNHSHSWVSVSLPEFGDSSFFGKTILVVSNKFRLFLAHLLRK